MSTAAQPARPPYLEGIFAPVTDERTDVNLPVRGELPAGLAGHFVRNSPNPRFEPLGTYHWFDGDGMVHGMEVGGGRATYRNRYIRTKGLGIEEDAGRPLWTGIMMPVDLKNPHGPAKNTANTDLVFHNRKLLATWWLGDDPYRLSLPDLATVGPETLGGTRRCGMAAHPKLDPRTGELMFFDYSPVRPPYLTYAVADAEGKVVHTTPIDLPGPRLLHDIAITDRYTIFCDFPMTWDAAAMRQGKRRVVFHKELPARFGVLPRHAPGAQIRWFEAESCYMYHTINAYEDEGEIVLTGCRIDNPIPGDRNKWRDDVASLEILQLVPYLHRWRLDLATGETREEQLDDRPTEFPRMNNDRLGVRTRYSYNPWIAPRSELLFEGVIKYDAETGKSWSYRYGPGVFGGEVVFAPDPDGIDEDDGWLVTFTIREADQHSEFVVLDARNVEDGPVARVPIPRRVPIGFHAWWVPATALG